jgi:hypothetical protein
MCEVRAKAAWVSMMPAMALDEVITITSAAATIIFSMALSPFDPAPASAAPISMRRTVTLVCFRRMSRLYRRYRRDDE